MGHEMRSKFSFAPGYRNLNHGSFGASPTAIRDRANKLRDECETNPCPFIKYQFPRLLNDSRNAMGEFLGVPKSTIVFVPNATTAVNTVLRNLVWNIDGKDEIVHFDVIYGACGKTVSYVCEASRDIVRAREIRLKYPADSSLIVNAFRTAIESSRSEGFRPRIAIFDTISSNPALRFPFEELTAVCHAEGVLSLIDAAHGIGQIPLHLASLDPDFLVSNCHKWFYTPRGCAVFYVPERNQAMMRSTLPTSHGFIPRSSGRVSPMNTTDALDAKTEFGSNFEFVGTTDNFAFLTIADVIRWRKDVCGGEQAIQEYCGHLCRQGGRRVAEILGTTTLGKLDKAGPCCMVNILLPLDRATEGCGSLVKGNDGSSMTVGEWMQQTMISQYQTFMPVFPHQGAWWVRLSAQIYIEESDFEWAGWTLKKLCEEICMHMVSESERGSEVKNDEWYQVPR
ncbi:unnamed protein product [Penicillium olsonii]|uniref:Aminotransferase class V domain-containing protein n=1 Tax=Penicillium olsonii TaxID=99116 RepID=A0A9W4I1W0_PENOL|nr:unnamed protein product [Penicillium olsonii]CAG8239332.1 unnamed protein product [Penicillium olsonii]